MASWSDAGDSPSGDAANYKTVAEANNAFAIDLYRHLAAEETGDIFFSPLSIETALAMTAAGARAHTLEEMAKVLHVESASALGANGDTHRLFAGLLKHLNGDGNAATRNYDLSV